MNAAQVSPAAGDARVDAVAEVLVGAIEPPIASAQHAGLRYADRHGSGITRAKRGRTFTYRHDSGRHVTAADRKRIAALVIPPAWTTCGSPRMRRRTCKRPRRDARGRTQYRYHPRWRQARDERSITT